MISFATYILDKTSTDETLFIDELRELIIMADKENQKEFKLWCMANYGNLYREKMITIFNSTENK